MEAAFIIVIAFLYFVPATVATVRKHSNKRPIFYTNLFLGWTFIGWVVAFIWAMTDNVVKQDVNKND